jgi:hypothetical protein
MKKFIAVLLTGAMTFSLAACGSTEEKTAETETVAADTVEADAETAEAETTETEDAAEQETATAEETETEEAAAGEKSEGVMTYDEYVAAELETEVVVETYVQAKQSWWEEDGQGKATFYTQDEDGAYFIYNMPCTQEEYDKLTQGTKIKVTGYKSEWSGEVEIIDATYEIEDGSYIAEALDVTDKLGSDDLINYQNQFVAFKDMTVEDAGDGAAYLYNWDGSGSDGDDLYFNVSSNGQTYTFTVESYLCDATSEVYNAVKNLKVGDTVDMEGFLYWYEGVNPHITSVTVK